MEDAPFAEAEATEPFAPTFVNELPTVTRKGRTSTKWLGVIEALKGNAGVWAEVHQSPSQAGSNSYAQTLRTNHGTQNGVPNSVSFASRNGKVYARYNTDEQRQAEDNKAADLAAKRAAAESEVAV